MVDSDQAQQCTLKRVTIREYNFPDHFNQELIYRVLTMVSITDLGLTLAVCLVPVFKFVFSLKHREKTYI